MGDILFFLKMIVFTVIFILMMQIKLGPTTLEQKTLHWIHHSSVLKPAQDVAQGAVLALKSFWNETLSHIDTRVKKTFNSDQAPGNRSLGIELKRSKAYLKEVAEKAKHAIKDKKDQIMDHREQQASKKNKPVLWGEDEPAW